MQKPASLSGLFFFQNSFEGFLMKIWVDADACPVKIKELIFKAAIRTQTSVVFVANKSMKVPLSPLISLVLVSSKFDAADHYIVEHSQEGDLAISSDILLAASLVDKNVSVISNSGKLYNKENVKEAKTMRNLHQELREGGLIAGDSPPFGPKDIQNFANAFDRELTRLLRA